MWLKSFMLLAPDHAAPDAAVQLKNRKPLYGFPISSSPAPNRKPMGRSLPFGSCIGVDAGFARKSLQGPSQQGVTEMFGRLGSIYFLHLTEAQAQRRRLSPKAARPADANLAVFLRLIGVIAIGLCAASLVSMAVA